MNLLASISIAAFAINLFIAVFVLFHDRRRLLNQLFFLCGCLLSAWSLATFVLTQPIPAPDALRWTRLLLVCSALVPAVIFHLIVLFFDMGARQRRVLLPSYAAAILLGVAGWLGLLDAGVHPVPSPAAGPAASPSPRWYGSGNTTTSLLFINGALLGTYGLWLLARTIRQAAGLRRAKAYYFLVGIVPCAVAAVHDFAGAYLWTYPTTQLPFAPAFPVASAFWAALVGYTLLRYRLIDLDAAITRGMVRTVTSAVLVIPFFLLLLVAQQAYHGEVYLDFSTLTLAICALAAFVVPRLSAAAEQRLGNVLLGHSRNYRDALVAFSSEATRILDLDTLIERVAQTLTSTLGVSAAALYVTDTTGGWCLGGQRGCYLPRLPDTLDEQHVLVRWLGASGQPAVREELELGSKAGDGPAAAAAMAEIGAELALPLTTPEGLEGIILLGARDDGALFTEEDLTVLTILANHLATAMGNARLYADLKRSRELMQRSDRLSAIGTMAAGLAHEIRNPLVSIRTFTQLLPERIDDAEFRESFFDLTLSEVDRICALINELLAFARPAPAELVSMDVNECLERICLLLETQARNGGVRLAKRFHAGALAVTADEDQIKQVVMNVVLNAVHACAGRGDGGLVEIWSYPIRLDHGRHVCIEISDNGCGMEEATRARIFDPFFTTRREGTGLGLSIAHQIVTRHGGLIDVRTDIDKGTAFYINLPVEPPAIEHAPPAYEAEDLRLHG